MVVVTAMKVACSKLQDARHIYDVIHRLFDSNPSSKQSPSREVAREGETLNDLALR